MGNKVRFGLSKCYYSIYNPTAKTWGTPVAIPYAQSLSIDRNKSSNDVYADNKLIYHIASLNSATINVQFSVIEDTVKQALLGHKADSSNANNVEVTNGTPIYFALLFQIEGDVEKRRKVFYMCTASLGSESYETTGDSVEAVGESLEITAYPVECGDDFVLDADADENDSNYATFFTAAPALPTI